MKTIHWIKRQFAGSSKGVEWMTNILFPITAAMQCVGTGLPIILDILLFTIVFFVLLFLGRGLLVKVLRPICKPYVRTFINGGILLASLLIYLYTSVNGRVTMKTIILYSLLVTLIECLFFRGLYILFRLKKRNILPGIMLVITGIMNITLCVFVLSDGIKTNTISEYKALSISSYTEEKTERYAQALKKGSYTVKTVDYGMDPEDDLVSGTINMSSYLWDSTGIKKWTRDTYLGYDATKVPLKGRIWYPEEETNCPVIFIVHGNHNLITDSYLGYGYLGEHLASRGYVVVSVDENACNYYWPEGLSGENAGRAYLLLENMRNVQGYNQSGPLEGKLDYNKLTLIGHSRGGEAVALAALYNQIGHNPDVGYQQYSYDFSIASVIAIAPSVDQYRPSGRDVVLTDVNYLLIQGSNDQDVSSFMGMKQYNHVEFTGEKECYKSYLYIAGANHGQFNTMWQQDYPFPRNFMLNSANLLKDTEQREILTGYITAFIEDTAQGKVENISLFQDNNHLEGELPETIYISNYCDSSFLTLADYEEDIALDTATIESATLRSSGLCFNNEQEVMFNTNSSSFQTDSHAAYLWWNRKDASYGLDFAEKTIDLSQHKYLQLDIADADEEKIQGEVTDLLDFTVQLKDASGRVSSIGLSRLCNIYPPLLVRLYKLQDSKDEVDVKKVFQTVRIPLSMFQETRQDIDLMNIASIQFVFDRTEEGRILVDNIGVSK